VSLSRQNLLELQNGSDVRGVAMAGVSGEAITLTDEAVNRIAGAFVHWLAARTEKDVSQLKIGVGHDSRISADRFKVQVLKAVTALKANAFDCGLASTPAMFMSTIFTELNFDGTIMLTASHLPYNRNGMKFFTKMGGLEKTEITELLDSSVSCPLGEADIKRVDKVNLMQLYSTSLCEKICKSIDLRDQEKPLEGLHIIVDAGNGAGGFFATQVLEKLGANISGSQFLEPDGYFPNHIPNPEDEKAMLSLQNAVLQSKADLGIIFDTDVDRMSAVLKDGTVVSRNAIIAMMAAIVAREAPGSTIVTDSVTSDMLTEFIEKDLGCKHRRFKRGYKNVINECIRLNNSGVLSPLAIETSGHGALKENYYLDDGSYLAVKIIIEAVHLKRQHKELSALIARLKHPYADYEFRMKILDNDFHTYGQYTLAAFEKCAREKGLFVVPNSYEGVRIAFSGETIQGWALLRTSLHDPVMALNIEGHRLGDCKNILDLVKTMLRSCVNLDKNTLDVLVV
jgi:phosphomannomutase